MPRQYRQGDVFLTRVREIPDSATAVVTRDRGRVVLAYGEVTGHAHAIDAALAELFEDRDGVLYLTIHAVGASIQHEEHAAIELPIGMYRVTRQLEYTPEAIRRVLD